MRFTVKHILVFIFLFVASSFSFAEECKAPKGVVLTYGFKITARDVLVKSGISETCNSVGKIPANKVVEYRGYKFTGQKPYFFLVKYKDGDTTIKGFVNGRDFTKKVEIWGVMLRDAKLDPVSSSSKRVQKGDLVHIIQKQGHSTGHVRIIFAKKSYKLPKDYIQVLSPDEYQKKRDELYPAISRDATITAYTHSFKEPYDDAYRANGSAHPKNSFNVKTIRKTKDGSWHYISWENKGAINVKKHKGWVPSKSLKLGPTQEELVRRAAEKEKQEIARKAREIEQREREAKRLALQAKMEKVRKEKEKARKEAEIKAKKQAEEDRLLKEKIEKRRKAQIWKERMTYGTVIYLIIGAFLLVSRIYRDYAEITWMRIYSNLYSLVGFRYLPQTLVVSFGSLGLLFLLYLGGLGENIFHYLFFIAAIPAVILVAISVLALPVTLFLLPGLVMTLYHVYEYYSAIRPDVLKEVQKGDSFHLGKEIIEEVSDV